MLDRVKNINKRKKWKLKLNSLKGCLNQMWGHAGVVLKGYGRGIGARLEKYGVRDSCIFMTVLYSIDITLWIKI